MAKLKLPSAEDLARQPLDHIPDNEVSLKATTSDGGKTADVRVSAQKTTKRGTEIGVFGEVKLGAGKPQGSAGFEVKKKFGRKKRR